jgi:uncharacterized membrane protein YeiH
VPLIFSGELYATVSIVTGVIYYLGLQANIVHDAVTVIAVVVGFTLRILAIRFNWAMPKFIYDKDLR